MELRNTAFHLLRQLFQQHTARWQHELPELTKPQYAVMRVIAEHPGIEQVDLTEAAVSTKATLAEMLSRMENRGLVKRENDPLDKRRRFVYLTVQGQSVVMMVALLAPACSPAIGGLLVETCGWRWIFFATLPVAVLTLLLAYRWLNVASTTMASARLLHLPLLTDKLLRFAMIVYLCVPGMFIGISVVGMFYLQNVAQLSPAAAGSLMLPWSIASFVAIMLTGRYFNRLGPRPLIIVGCLLQAAGILLLTNVTPATSHRVLMMIFALMGAGGSLCSSTAQSGAFLTIARRDMPDASALWNLNRQLSFFLGATLLTLLLNALQRVMSLEVAYRWTFIAAAGITLLPLIYAVCLNNRQALLCLKKERS